MPRKRKPPDPPDTPGTTCPNCGQIRTPPKNGNPKYPNMYPHYDSVPHTDLTECIRFLKYEIENLRDHHHEPRGEGL